MFRKNPYGNYKREDTEEKRRKKKELKIEFLKENVGNVFYFSEDEYQNNNLFNSEMNHCISCRYIYVYENDGEVLTKHILTKHITESDPTRYSNGCADWRYVVHKTVYDKVLSGIGNFDYLDKLIENGIILKELPEEIEYLIDNVDNYNLSNCCAFVVSDDDSLKDRMKRIKYFIKKYVDSV